MDEIYELHPISAIELLGHAKNNIVEVEEMEDKLPATYRFMLVFAYDLLNEVQEHLYNN